MKSGTSIILSSHCSTFMRKRNCKITYPSTCPMHPLHLKTLTPGPSLAGPPPLARYLLHKASHSAMVIFPSLSVSPTSSKLICNSQHCFQSMPEVTWKREIQSSFFKLKSIFELQVSSMLHSIALRICNGNLINKSETLVGMEIWP